MFVRLWQGQENFIEGTAGVRAVTIVEESKDTFLALLIVSSAVDLQLDEWKNQLIFLDAGAVGKATYVHYPAVSFVETRVIDGSI